MLSMTTYTVRTKRWAHGWEIHIDGVGVTRSRTRETAEQTVPDYLETLTSRDTAGDIIEARPDCAPAWPASSNARRASA
jgi:hypothetical protein